MTMDDSIELYMTRLDDTYIHNAKALRSLGVSILVLGEAFDLAFISEEWGLSATTMKN